MNTKKIVKFGDICQEVKLTTKDPISDGFEYYIGLEHLDSNSLTIKRWGIIRDDNPSFTRVFKKGHILFGKRRSYLKKAAIAKFDGICSSDIIVMEPIGDIVLHELVPYIIQSEPFWDFAIRTSSGSLSPRTKWKDLATYTFNISEQQGQLLKLFQTMEKTLVASNNLLDSAEQKKKALIQNLLTGQTRLLDEKGNKFNKEWKEYTLNDLFIFKKGKGLSKAALKNSGQYKCILYGELYTKYSEVINQVVSFTDCNEGELSKTGDILIPSSTTTCGMDLAIAYTIQEQGVLLGGDINILRPKKSLSSIFMAYLLTYIKKRDIASRAQGITIIHLYGTDLKNLKVLMPDDLKEQQKIANILVQVEEEIIIIKDKINKLRILKNNILLNSFN